MLSTVVAVFLFVIVAAFFKMGVTIYNGLVSLRAQVERAWSNIDVILKQRFDELPQLIQVVEQYASYEAGVIKEIADARTRYGSSNSVSEKIQASQEISMALKGVFAIGEAYPDLKANQQFVQLQSRISSLESTIADRRETYNDAVTNFNTRIEQFPDVFAARFLDYERQDLFEVADKEKVVPNLKMNLPKFGSKDQKGA